MLSFRKARTTDLEAIYAIEQDRFGMDAFHKRQLYRLIKNEGAQFILASASDVIVGYFILLFRRNSRQARLYSLAVVAGSEGKGLGQQLMVEAEKLALEKKCTLLKLEVRKDNTRAIQLYERNGYNVHATIPEYYKDGQDAMIMRKVLA